jgi:MGT family glycosyltransferase
VNEELHDTGHATGRPLRILLGAFGDPGHAFPILALGSRLVARGHAVTVQTWRRWQDGAEAAGMTFAAAPEYQVFPTRERPLKPYEAAVVAARETVPLVRDGGFDVCVSDILTLAPALAAEICDVPVATLVPHLYPHNASGRPPWSLGARAPRTALGARMWRATDRLVEKSLERGRADYNDARAALGLPPRKELHTGLSRSLTMVATLPHLEYPREWPSWTRVTGPLIWEPPGDEVLPPPGDGPVVLVAPSTSQDPDHALLRAALEGLAGEPVRVIATWNGREPDRPLPRPGNAVLVPWLSYTQTMPHCDLVITHAGHGTVVRALTLGRPILACPAAGDMGENAARIAWAGLGTRIPRRLLSPATVRITARRVLTDPSMRARAEAVARWAAGHDGAAAAAMEVEAWAARMPAGTPSGRLTTP